MSKKIIIIVSLAVLFSVIFPLTFSFAQEEQTGKPTEEEIIAEVEKEITAEEEVNPEDLEIKEPRLLPDSPFYFVKNWWRGLRLAFTFNPVKDAQLRAKFANEKLLELKKLAEKKKDPKILEKARRNYEKEVEALQKAAEKLKTVKDKKAVESFLDKFIRHQILHQKLLEKLEKQVPEEAFEKIKKARERHLERFKDVMLKLEEMDKLPERLEKALEKAKGSALKEFKQLEILRKIREKVKDEKAKEALEKAEAKVLNRLKGKIENLLPEQRMRIKNFIEKLPGDKEKQLEILEDLKERLKDRKEIREQLEKGREKILEKIIEEKREILKKKDCPKLVLPGKDFCKEGRVIIRKDEKGCPQFVCVKLEDIIREIPHPEIPLTPRERRACIEVWDPVCGKDGKTYSNACFAKVAGVEVAHKGVCENIISECAKEGEKVNRNPFLGPTNKVCCPGLIEVRESKSYGICRKPEDVIQVFEGECKTDKDCPQPKCPGVHSRCVNGKCLIPKCEPAEELFPKTPGKIVTCCMPGNVCVRTNKENCEWGGGKVVEAKSCHPDPCKKSKLEAIPKPMPESLPIEEEPQKE
jgi:hypothetical protein